MDWLALHRSPTFQETLQTQVVSDSYHDFKKVFRDIYTTYPDVGTPYIKPVRIASDGWDLIGKMTGIHSLASDPVGTQYSVRFPIHDSLQSPLYKISVLDEKDVVGVANALCGTSTHANLLLDALTGHWWANTLKAKGPFSGKTFRVLTNRETVSDPAPKIPPNDDCYLKGVGKVVGLESYQDETPHAITYPAFGSLKFDPRRNFFSRYDLELSPVGYQYNCEEVILTFRGTSEASIPVQTTGQGRFLNGIATLRTKLEAFLRGAFTPKNMFQYHTTIQQKRSGDSLQVLSSLDTGRLYANVFVEGPGIAFPATIPTYVVTNDTWNTVPFGLASGANVVLLYGTKVIVFEAQRTEILVQQYRENPSYLGIGPENYATQTAMLEETMNVVGIREGLTQLQTQIQGMTTQNPTDKKTIQELQSRWNQLLGITFRNLYAIGTFYYSYAPIQIVFAEPTASQEAIWTTLQAIQAQLLRQRTNETAKTAFNAILGSEEAKIFQEIPYLNLEGDVMPRGLQARIKSLFAMVAVLQTVPSAQPLIQGVFQTLVALEASPFVQNRYKVSSKKTGFLLLLSLWISTMTYQHSANDTLPDIQQKAILSSYLLERERMSSLLLQSVLQRGGRRTRKNQRGGADFIPPEVGLPVFQYLRVCASANSIFETQFFQPWASLYVQQAVSTASLEKLASPLRGGGQDVQDSLLDLLFAQGLCAWIPDEEEADDLGKWAPILVGIFTLILYEKDLTKKKVMYHCFLQMARFEPGEVATALQLSSTESWVQYGSHAIASYMSTVFGAQCLTVLSKSEDQKESVLRNVKSWILPDLSYQEAVDQSWVCLESARQALQVPDQTPLPPGQSATQSAVQTATIQSAVSQTPDSVKEELSSPESPYEAKSLSLPQSTGLVESVGPAPLKMKPALLSKTTRPSFKSMLPMRTPAQPSQISKQGAAPAARRSRLDRMF